MNDWYIDTLDKASSVPIYQRTQIVEKDYTGCFKIVATTNKELLIDYSGYEYGTGREYKANVYLPQISPEFQQAWVKAMNNNVPIVDALMEMEEEILYTDDGLDYKGDLQPKLNEQGYVTILPITEKMYNIKEVENIVKLTLEDAEKSVIWTKEYYKHLTKNIIKQYF